MHDKDYAFQYGLEAHGRSSVVLDHAGVGTQCNGSFDWAFFDDAHLDAGRVEGTDDGDGHRVLGNVIARGRGHVVLRNTTVAGAERAEDAGRIDVE